MFKALRAPGDRGSKRRLQALGVVGPFDEPWQSGRDIGEGLMAADADGSTLTVVMKLSHYGAHCRAISSSRAVPLPARPYARSRLRTAPRDPYGRCSRSQDVGFARQSAAPPGPVSYRCCALSRSHHPAAAGRLGEDHSRGACQAVPMAVSDSASARKGPIGCFSSSHNRQPVVS